MNLREIAIAIFKCALFNNDSELGGAFWFLRDLFVISIAYCFCSFIVTGICRLVNVTDEDHRAVVLNIIQGIVSGALLLTDFYFSMHEITIGGVGKITSCNCLFYIGHLFALKECKEKIQKLNEKNWLFILIITFGLLLPLNHFGSISLANNRYENPAFLLTASVSGWLWLYGIAFFICKLKSVKGLTGIYKLVLYSGQHTLIIVLLHFLTFKIGNFIAYFYYNCPGYCIATFPTLCGNIGAWWILFTLIWVAVPLIVSRTFTGVKNKVSLRIGG